MEYYEQTNCALLQKRAADLAEKARKEGMSHSKFLSPAQQASVSGRFAKRADITFLLSGGFPEAERQIAVFLNPDFGEYVPETVLCALVFSHRVQDAVSHRDILGAALALGIDRGVLGDILIEPERAVVVCLREMGGFLLENLTMAGKTGLQGAEIPLDILQKPEELAEEITDTVQSLRLDAVLASAFSVSRSMAADLVRAKKAKLRHEVCLNKETPVRAGDVISVLGQGKAVLLSAEGRSRKGRTYIKIAKYK
jgi:RNA-binding protein YlmH